MPSGHGTQENVVQFIKRIRARARRSSRRAQGLTEYVIILGLIAIVCVGAVQALGTAIDEALTTSGNEVRTKITSQIGKTK